MKSIIALISGVGSTIWKGYVLSVLWAWFIVATFFSAPVLSVAAAIGICLIVRFLTYKVSYKDVDDDREFSLQVVMSWIMPTAALVVGFVVKLFM